MEYTTLGRTGLRVSVAGLGCGGNSKIGQTTGQTLDQSIALIHQAVDLGVNFFDTARSYGTEKVLGEAIRSVPRDSVVISTKHHAAGVSDVRIVEELDGALRDLQTDYVDIFHLHGVRLGDYDHALNVLVPALLRERERGKVRFIGITEASNVDHEQTMLQRAVGDDCWDVAMFAFNMMHQVARTRVLPHAMEGGIGTLIMFVVRYLFSVPGELERKMKELAANGQVPALLGDSDDPLGFLLHEEGADSVIEAAYRFARHEPGAHVVLFGTGNPAHLEANIKSILKPPLPEADRARLAEMFGHLRGVGLELPRSR